MGNCSPMRTEVLEFKVCNVDAKLFKHSKGLIKITNNDMILRQNNRSDISWPLNGIRRYGCYRDIFLFECGRKCPTGEGLFAFKCSRAQLLNDTLHEALVRKENGTIAPLTVSTKLPPRVESPNLTLIIDDRQLQQEEHEQQQNGDDIIYTTTYNISVSNITSNNNNNNNNNNNLIKFLENNDTRKIRDHCFKECSTDLNYIKPSAIEKINNININNMDEEVKSDLLASKVSSNPDYSHINETKTIAIQKSKQIRGEYLKLSTPK